MYIHSLLYRISKLLYTKWGRDWNNRFEELFSRQRILKFFSLLEMLKFCEDSYTFRYQGRCKGSVSDKGKMKSPFSFLSLSLPGSRSSSPAPQTRHSSHIQHSKQLSELLFTPGRQVLFSLVEHLSGHIQPYCLHPSHHQPRKKSPHRSIVLNAHSSGIW